MARLCVTIGRYWYLFKRLTAVSAGRFYRFEHIVTYSSRQSWRRDVGEPAGPGVDPQPSALTKLGAAAGDSNSGPAELRVVVQSGTRNWNNDRKPNFISEAELCFFFDDGGRLCVLPQVQANGTKHSRDSQDGIGLGLAGAAFAVVISTKTTFCLLLQKGRINLATSSTRVPSSRRWALPAKLAGLRV